MTLEYATILSFKVWIWLFRNLGRMKQDSPYWDEIWNMEFSCPMCEVWDTYCLKCVLGKNNVCREGFIQWANTGKKQYSAHIAWTLRKEIIKNGWII